MLSYHLSIAKILLFICLYDVCISFPHSVQRRKQAEDSINTIRKALYEAIWGNPDLLNLMYCNNPYNISLNNTATCKVIIYKSVLLRIYVCM